MSRITLLLTLVVAISLAAGAGIAYYHQQQVDPFQRDADAFIAAAKAVK